MKRLSLFLLICFASLILAPIANASNGCTKKNAQEISVVFERAIDINERFKKSLANKDEDAYRSLRAQVENYSEETVFPCVYRAASMLSKQNDRALMHQLMKLVISFDNSADETLSASLGNIFARNPEAIELSIMEFPKDEQKIIAKSVQTGWANAKKGLNAKLIKERDARAKRLAS